MKKDKIIIIDADVTSHFITGKEIYALPAIFPYKIKRVIGAGSKLPVKRIEDFKCKDLKTI